MDGEMIKNACLFVNQGIQYEILKIISSQLIIRTEFAVIVMEVGRLKEKCFCYFFVAL